MSFNPRTGKLTPDADGMVSIEDAIKAQQWAAKRSPRIVKTREKSSSETISTETVEDEKLVTSIIETTSEVAARSLLKALSKRLRSQ